MIYALTYFLISSLSFATVTNFSAVGASKTYDVSTSVYYEIWAGVAPSTTCPSTTTATCDTCGSGNLGAMSDSCNSKTVGVNGKITFTFASDINKAGYLTITKDTDEGELVYESTTETAAGGPYSITLDLKVLCDKLTTNGSATCALNGTGNFRVGINTNINTDKFLVSGTDDFKKISMNIAPEITGGADKNSVCTVDPTVHGICDYEMVPGDNKAYLATYGYSDSFPTVASLKYSAIRLYYAIGPCASATFNHSKFSDLSLTVSGTSFTAALSGEGAVEGLENDSPYCFRSAIVDKAGNIRGFTTTASLTTSHEATPSKVVGLLEEGNCFIATAAYGNPLADKIDTFRDFRDEVLLKFSIGQKLVNFYYQNSKPLAIEIFKHPWAQSLTRYVLWPIWFLIEVMLNYPIALVLMGLALIATSRRRENVI